MTGEKATGMMSRRGTQSLELWALYFELCICATWDDSLRNTDEVQRTKYEALSSHLHGLALTTGLNRTDAPSFVVSTLTRGGALEVELEAYVMV